MSKNTERGMGHQAGPVADGRPDEIPRGAAERPAASSSAGAEGGGDGAPVRLQRSDVGQVTLLGVSAPVFERDKTTARDQATAPGRDVHLPAEARRAAMARPITGDGGSPVALPPRRLTPDPPVRTLVDPTPAPTVRISKTKIITPASGSTPERSPYEARGAYPVGRREPDPAGIVDDIGGGSGVGASVVLGIGLSVVLALIVVGLARFGPHVRTAGPLPVQPFEGRPDPRLEAPGLGRRGGDPEGRGSAVAGQPVPGGDSVRAREASPAEPPAVAGAAGAEDVAAAPTPSGTPASVVPPQAAEAIPGSTAQAAIPDARTPPPVFDEIREGRPANDLADKAVRRPVGRPRAVTSVGDRGPGSPGGGANVAPNPRRSPVRSLDSQSASVGAAAAPGAAPNGFPPAAPAAAPSPFQPPPITSPRVPPSRGDEAKPPYDPDSPLPPASE